jgi:hypothetical protein
MMEIHGMRKIDCPSCGGKTRECDTCKGKGIMVQIEKPEACGPDCPIAQGLIGPF